MPKRTTRRESHRPAPYNLRTPTSMAIAVVPAMSSWAPHHHQHNLSWSSQHLDYPTHPQMMPSYMHQMHLPQPEPPSPQRPSSTQPGQSVPWTATEDDQLISAKDQGIGWNEISRRFFPQKSANACRKRHERVMNKVKSTDWDEGRIDRVIQEYNRHGRREEVWGALAVRCGERWEDVERVCFQQGLKGLRVNRSTQSRVRSRASSGARTSNEYTRRSPSDKYEHLDDSGIDLGQGQLIQSASPTVIPQILHQSHNGYGY